MTSRNTCTPLARMIRATAALLLALAWLVLPAPHADAAGDPGIERPSAGERITQDGAFTAVAYQDAATGEEVRAMEARLFSDGRQIGTVHNMDFKDSLDNGPGVRRTRWTVALDPIESWDDGYPLRNGNYRLEVRATIAFQGVPRQPSAWRAVDFTFDVDPPITIVRSSVIDASARKIEVSWDPIHVPDFVKYLVQRKSGDGDWANYREVVSVDKTRWADTFTADGDFAYRVQTYRRAADGRSLRKSLWSPATAISVRKPAPPPPPPSSSGGASGGADAGPPVVHVRRAPVPRAPTFSGPDTYDETLDYSDTELPLASGPEFDEPGEEDSSLTVREDREFPLRQALVPVATGLLLTVSAWHVRRFMKVPD